MDSTENSGEEGQTLMALAPRLQALLSDIQGRKAQRKKRLVQMQREIQSAVSTEAQRAASEVLKIVLAETFGRDEEILALLVISIALASYLDQLNVAMKAIQEHLQELGGRFVVGVLLLVLVTSHTWQQAAAPPTEI